MKKIIKIALYLFIIGLLAGVGVYLYVFHKPHRNLANEKPAFVCTAENLYNEFSANDTASYSKYGNKAIEVSGNVVEKTVTPKEITIVLFDSMGGVSCSFDSTYISENKDKFEKIKSGANIIVRGQCDGADPILGVVLTSCVLPEAE